MMVDREEGTVGGEGSERAADLDAGLSEVRARIDAARVAAGRSDAVTLVVVTKTFPASDVDILAELGVSDVGENRDQEAGAKRAVCSSAAARLTWHMIGQVQRKKAGSVARWADVVESVDRSELAVALGRSAAAADRSLDVYIQVNLDPDPRPGRGGVTPDGVPALADEIGRQDALVLRGLMGVAPYPGDPVAAFARLQELSGRLRGSWPAADRISAGMSGDLEQAIAHGATQVRVGGAVLGARAMVQ